MSVCGSEGVDSPSADQRARGSPQATRSKAPVLLSEDTIINAINIINIINVNNMVRIIVEVKTKCQIL